jgi:Concanavalin A-like lectin/glucanases superfamily
LVNHSLGLVAHYNLDANGLDSSGNGVNGTIVNNVIPIADRFGTPNAAMFFPTNSDGIVGTGLNIANSSSSLSLWVNKQYVGNLFNGTWILHVGSAGDTNQTLHIALDYGSSIRYDFFRNTFDINTPILPYNEWHHLAFTFDNITNQRAIYVDGGLVATDTASGDFVGNSAFYLGSMNIEMDDVRFYTRVLSPTEVQMAYNVPEPSTAIFCVFSALVLAQRRNRR